MERFEEEKISFIYFPLLQRYNLNRKHFVAKRAISNSARKKKIENKGE